MRLTRLWYRLLSAMIYPAFNRKVVVVQGLDHLPLRSGYILASNHVDWLDGFYLTATTEKYRGVPTNFLTRSNNYWWTTIAIQIPADRSDIIEVAVRNLKRGQVICNYPEGARNTTDKLLPGKTGTVRMAVEAGVPVVPVGITCDGGRSMAQSLQFLFSSRHPVTLSFGTPMTFTPPPEGMTNDWLNEVTNDLMHAIAPLAHKA